MKQNNKKILLQKYFRNKIKQLGNTIDHKNSNKNKSKKINK